jgi:5-formyltetrahydrofolate cyclo-ligase
VNALDRSRGDTVRTGKDKLRRDLRARRDGIAKATAIAAAAHAAARLLTLPEIEAASVIALYAAVAGELDTEPLDAACAARGVTRVYPRVVQARRELRFHRVDDRSSLLPGTFRIPEPPTELPTLAAADIDVFVVPGIAFDELGGRIGWGHGYYDAQLVTCPRALRVGYAFELQVVDHVPSEPTDARMDIVITEARLVRCQRGARGPSV